MRVSAHAGWAGRWCGWCACVPLVGRTVVAWLSLVFVSAPLLFCLTRNRYPWGVWVHVPPEALASRRKRWGTYKASVVEW